MVLAAGMSMVGSRGYKMSAKKDFLYGLAIAGNACLLLLQDSPQVKPGVFIFRLVCPIYCSNKEWP